MIRRSTIVLVLVGGLVAASTPAEARPRAATYVVVWLGGHTEPGRICRDGVVQAPIPANGVPLGGQLEVCWNRGNPVLTHLFVFWPSLPGAQAGTVCDGVGTPRRNSAVVACPINPGAPFVPGIAVLGPVGPPGFDGTLTFVGGSLRNRSALLKSALAASDAYRSQGVIPVGPQRMA